MKMKKLQKLSATAIVLAMCLLLTVTAWATNSLGVTYTAALDATTLCVSDKDRTVTLTVATNNPVEMDAMTALVKVPDALTLKEIKNDTLNFTELHLENGMITWYSSDAEDVTTSLLAVVEITVPANTPAGTYTISFEIIDISKGYGKDVWENGITVDATLTVSNHADGDDTDHACDNCDTVIEDHTPGTAVEENRKEPACQETGSYDTVVYCTECGEKLSSTSTVIPATGHTEGEAVVENNVAPDCENTGSYDNVVYCTVCNTELSRVEILVDALGHSYEVVVTPPSCTAQGYTTHTCSVCDDSYVDSYVDALGHTEGETVVENNVAPDCDDAGSYDEVVYCTVCGEEISRKTVTVDALGHEWEPHYIDNEDGTHTATYTCGNDASHTKSGETEEHTYTDGICVCGAEEPVSNIAVIDKTNGNATYTVEGNVVTVTCSVACKVGYWSETDGKYIAISAVANGDGSYSFTAPEGVTEVLLVVKGDANGDGNVNMADATRARAHFNSKTTLTAEQQFAADANGDNIVNMADATRIRAAFNNKTVLIWG